MHLPSPGWPTQTCVYFIQVYASSLWWLLFSHSVASASATPWTAARQASLPFTVSQDLLRLMSIELMMPSNCLILCCPLLLPPSIFPNIIRRGSLAASSAKGAGPAAAALARVPAACSFPGENARSWEALGEARPGQSSLSAGRLGYNEATEAAST